MSNMNNNSEEEAVKIIIDKITQFDIILTRADNGNTVIASNKLILYT